MRKVVVGIDIGGTNTAFGIVDSEGIIYGTDKLSTVIYPDVDNFMNELCGRINNLLGALPFIYELVGVGVGAPNANFYKGTIEDAPNLPWKGIVPFVEKFQGYFSNVPVYMTNDAKAAALGEMIYGAAKGMRNFIVITLGTGLGSGFVVDGHLMLEHDSIAGELGHVTINPNGRICGCGRRGCLETYASATGIKRTVFKLLADHTADSEFRKLSYNQLTAEMITKSALNGDPLAIEAYEYTGRVLGSALANAVTITDPEAIFLFGGLARAGKYILEPTKRYMEASLMSNFRGKVKILLSSVDGMNAAILGASALVWHHKEASS
ncbi:MAG: ROK family protein [Rikenellaceae bacterium]|nr:ROK family protein [Rikenellaceae bacterium]